VEESAYIGGIIVGLGYLVAGARIFRLSLLTRKNPERLLAAALSLWSLSYACFQLPLIINDESAFRPFYVAGRFLTDAGSIASAFFLRLVFHPDSRFATALVASITISLVLGVAGSAWVGDWESIYPLRNPYWWLEWMAIVVSVAWMGIEGFHHYGMSKLRRKLGLCDALACNRYLLWGLTGAVWTIYEFVYVIQQTEFDATGSYSGSLDSVASTLELIPIACIWLVFFPPTIYQRWIERFDSDPRVAET